MKVKYFSSLILLFKSVLTMNEKKFTRTFYLNFQTSPSLLLIVCHMIRFYFIWSSFIAFFLLIYFLDFKMIRFSLDSLDRLIF